MLFCRATSSATIQSSVLPPTGTLTFAQLEDAINKWTIDLEDQTKIFINQAKQLNAWDRLLISNGEKVCTYTCDVQKIQTNQLQLTYIILDFDIEQWNRTCETATTAVGSRTGFCVVTTKRIRRPYCSFRKRTGRSTRP